MNEDEANAVVEDLQERFNDLLDEGDLEGALQVKLD